MRKGEKGLKGRGSSGILPHLLALLSPLPKRSMQVLPQLLRKTHREPQLSTALGSPQLTQPLISYPGSSCRSWTCSQLCVVLEQVAVVLHLPLCSKQMKFSDTFLRDCAVAAAQARSCSREHRATPWPALAVLTLLKAALRKGESYWMSIKMLQWFKRATSMHYFVTLHPSISS